MDTPIDKYIRNVLQPTNEETEIFKSKIRSMKALFEHNSSTLNLKECRPAGSFEKGTMLRYKPELDLVMVLNRQQIDYEVIKNEVSRLIKKNMPDSRILEPTKVSIRVGFSTKNKKKYEIEIVPTFWVNSPLKMHEVKQYRAYQGITSLWQTKYIKMQKNKYKYYTDLVMLLKDWRNEHDIPLASFHIELLIASALKYRQVEDDNPWEDDLKECYKEIVSFTDGSPIFPVDWKYFNEDCDLECFKENIIMVDPGDPKENLANKLGDDDLRIIKSKASSAMYHIKNGNYNKVFNRKGGLAEYSW